MFHNIGHKLQVFAKVFTWLGIIGGILFILLGVLSLVVVDPQENMVNAGIMLIVYGLLLPLLSWFWGLLLHGFAQLIQDTRKIRDTMLEEKQRQPINLQ